MSDSITSLPRVSLCVIAKNEAKNIEACLIGVRHLVCEMVVVDTGSTDGTAELAARMGAKVHSFSWCDDFSAARNESLRHATGDWILWLDADDRLEEESQKRLRVLLQSLGDDRVGYVFDTHCLGQFDSDGGMVVNHVRLFRNVPGVHWRGRVHEQLTPSLIALNFHLRWTDIVVKHLGYCDSADNHRKINRDLRLLRLEYAERPKDPAVLLHLGLAYARLGDASQSLLFLLQCHQAAARSRDDWQRKLFAALVGMLSRLGRFSEALSFADEGLEWFPFDPELSVQKSEHLLARDDLIGAERVLRDAYENPVDAYFRVGVPLGMYERELPRTLAHVLIAQQRFADAELILQKLIAKFPSFTQAWMTLGIGYLEARRFSDAEFVARQLPKCPDGQVFATTLEAGLHHAKQEWDQALQKANLAIAVAPQWNLPRIIVANSMLRLTQDVSAIVAAWRDVLRCDPSNAVARQVIQKLESRVADPVTR